MKLGKTKNPPKVHPGGFVLVNPPLVAPVEEIYNTLVRSNAASLDTSRLFLADEIMAALRSHPSTIDEFYLQQGAYNKLTYAEEKVKCEQNTCQSRITRDKRGNCVIEVTREFMENSDLKSAASLKLVSIGAGNSTIFSKIASINGRFIGLSPENESKLCCGTRKYQVYEVPTSFNYSSWYRTIKEIFDRKFSVQSYIYPRLTRSEISAEKYAVEEQTALNSLALTRESFNIWQKRAIAGILSSSSPSIPYILFGPPGTGKTTTLVEAVIQLLRKNSNGRILLCTPSNAAADHFTLALARTDQIERKKILRVYSTSHFTHEKEPEMMKMTHRVFSPFYGREVFGIPEKRNLLNSYRIFIMTLSASTYFVSGGLRGEFSHIIIDEAGQAREVETLVPIIGLATDNTRIVLAGDPKQLGPVETVKFVKSFKLNTSLLERFLNIDFYKNNDRRFTCMLRDNYRAHKALVCLPSEMIYDNKLVAAVPVTERDSLCQWRGLPNKGFPLFWHSIDGREESEKGGFSYKNVLEAETVVSYAQMLLAETDVTPEEIGIVTPYKYQAKLLRILLSDYAELTIDSVEKFQGSERRVILVSTVRRFGTGFLDCPKRLNTTITRAKELLIIVGHHPNMTTMKYWRGLVEYCRKNKALICNVVKKKSAAQGIDLIQNKVSSLSLTANGQATKIVSQLAPKSGKKKKKNGGTNNGDTTRKCGNLGPKLKSAPPPMKQKKAKNEKTPVAIVNIAVQGAPLMSKIKKQSEPKRPKPKAKTNQSNQKKPEIEKPKAKTNQSKQKKPELEKPKAKANPKKRKVTPGQIPILNEKALRRKLWLRREKWNEKEKQRAGF